jgi:putative iron-dependent peroxidase
MPATQHDALLWLAGAAYDVVFDEARAATAALAALADVAEETARVADAVAAGCESGVRA